MRGESVGDVQGAGGGDTSAEFVSGLKVSCCFSRPTGFKLNVPNFVADIYCPHLEQGIIYIYIYIYIYDILTYLEDKISIM